MHALQSAGKPGFVAAERFRQSPYCSDVAGSNPGRERADEIPKLSKQLFTSVLIVKNLVKKL